MTVPDFQTLMLPLLKLAADGQQHTLSEAVERLAEEFQLSEDDRAQLLKSGQTRMYNRVAWSTTYLRKAGLLQSVGPGRFQLTDRGREVLASRPAVIDVAYLDSRFPQMSDFRRVRSRGDVAESRPLPSMPMEHGTIVQALRNGSAR
jgi:restriction system protein